MGPKSGKNQGGNRRGARPRREKPEYDQKLVDLRRVARVMAGGRRFSFRATLIIGNKKGMVGLGTAKGSDTAIAIDKAFKKARKELFTVPLTKDGTIPYEVSAKFAGSRLLLRPAHAGRGIMAGGPVRIVCDLAGINNITGKIISRSTNKLNNAKATITALQKLAS
ncbi:MAG: 30S ribosomal protein S5 [Candidatus Ryanbacteria bacterium CG10_big_fil_rev_8_21_14_0_10_43_42]|uniref:Small ribosomal subunit protein uS5 n=1 Tax=Candidatus Ryanbacteria bacterium CG10_big_fil_rev_8_21_14_0_10_43_42 TaxID=1974864 RepID=A0A2M8KXZ1_9BACT|nr:MAG: 30S ribosomal protein S5 [Candidatus Ryanbacteria bacterium CG10_big_fil_rev_8_21_14_0_10_43_42]